ncbi:response regulator transcription factor [Guptibacillus hwajinpoensis]|uniref:Transcriptional regulator n=2 Tax=Guptibacillus hwajinpoensis TaxID=208199 RepID=A0A0J6FPF9_9BACL|nr:MULTISPECIES: response regulator transcription factor [Alkalihalobacillus]KMM36242.1 transcriptional regulator [Alkalihalobacillus macyae]MDP4551723.1 response regulator transcription factor [Alkalihalobacillus macyae]MDQ0484684.1 two-component system response regulator CssR [Alkalihalobacillus hemicentroti]
MEETYKVHLVEDEENLVQILKTYMEKEGFQVKTFVSGEEAMESIHESCHLWILDIMLPGIDGYELLKKIKAEDDVPVIFISARDEDLDRIVGLELGSDDYIAKPFMPRELIIRAKKLLKRVYQQPSQKRFEIVEYEIDPTARKVLDRGEPIELTTKEMDLILYLVDHVNQTLSREQILVHVWGDDYVGSDRAVDDVIRRVRKKMPRMNLETSYGLGYRLIT